MCQQAVSRRVTKSGEYCSREMGESSVPGSLVVILLVTPDFPLL